MAKAGSAVFAIAAIVGVAAIGYFVVNQEGDPAGEAADTGEPVQISLVLAATGTEFASEQRAGAEAAARDLGAAVELKIVGPPRIDPTNEVRIFENEAVTRPDAIIVAPVPPSLFTEPTIRAQADGIPVAFLMSPPEPQISDALFVGQREFDVARQVGRVIAEGIIADRQPQSADEITGVIVPGICVPGMINLEDRIQGLRAIFQEMLPNVEVAAALNTGNERGGAFAVWQQAVQATPDALAFVGVCENDFITLAKIKEDDGREFPLAVFDTPEQVRTSVASGTIAAAVPPSHFTSTYMAVWTMGRALLEGREAPTGWIETPILVVDGQNIAAFDVASSSPEEMGNYFQADIERLKGVNTDALPPIMNARPPQE